VDTLTIPEPSILQGKMSSHRSRTKWLVLILVWTLSGLYTASLLKRGWVPHDEGTIGQSAERVLSGQLPHRDFEDVYTGGLTYLNALSFRLFGETLLAPRIMLFLFFLAWVPAVYRIALHFTDALGGGAVTLLAVAWSLPNYTAALPSWYNLFFATFGLAATMRYLDTNARKWLFAAGLCCGISFLFKLSGIYFAAGVLLFLVFREQELARGDPRGQRPQRSLYSLFVLLGLAAFVAALIFLVRKDASAVVVVEFVMPGLALAILCLGREFAGIPAVPGRRFASLFRMLLPFAIGAALPVILFLIPYIRDRAVWDFVNGVFLLPGRRLAFAVRRPPGFSLNKILAAVALTGLLILAYRGRVRSRLAQTAIAFALLAILILSKAHPKIYAATWAPLLLLIPISSLAGILVLGDSRPQGLRRQQAMLLVSVAATCTLIQLPFSAGIYFCYVAPLLALSLLALFSLPPCTTRPVLALLLVFFLAFAAMRVTPGFLYSMGYFYQPNPQTERLTLPRAGGLRVDPAQAAEYEELIPEIQAHAGAGDYIYAAPDCPEVYFLSGKRNPTRTMFDFFDDQSDHAAKVLQAVDSHQIQAIAIFSQPEFSGPLPPNLVEALRARFPKSKQIGRFEVRWRP
jgi:hypothetical protein